ncbi:MAG: hypothetical protein KGP28_08985 [Bdellovibrionales bacterium]|nr:hypothetical protein [Bdellovibrionales bacterium]
MLNLLGFFVVGLNAEAALSGGTCLSPNQVVTVVASYNSLFNRDQKACCRFGSSFEIRTSSDIEKCKYNLGVEYLNQGKRYCCATVSKVI